MILGGIGGTWCAGIARPRSLIAGCIPSGRKCGGLSCLTPINQNKINFSINITFQTQNLIVKLMIFKLVGAVYSKINEECDANQHEGVNELLCVKMVSMIDDDDWSHTQTLRWPTLFFWQEHMMLPKGFTVLQMAERQRTVCIFFIGIKYHFTAV